MRDDRVKRNTGGSVRPAEPYLVGERGPERLLLSGTGFFMQLPRGPWWWRLLPKSVRYRLALGRARHDIRKKTAYLTDEEFSAEVGEIVDARKRRTDEGHR